MLGETVEKATDLYAAAASGKRTVAVGNMNDFPAKRENISSRRAKKLPLFCNFSGRY